MYIEKNKNKFIEKYKKRWRDLLWRKQNSLF